MKTGNEASQGSGEAPTDPPPGPAAGSLPRAVRPVNAVLALASIYLVGSTLGGFGLLAVTWGDPAEAIGAWIVLGGMLGLPLAIVLAWAGSRVERLVRGVSPRGWLWGPMGLGVAIVAHWAPVCLWAPVLVVASGVESRHSDDHLMGAILSLGALVVVAVGSGLTAVVARSLAARTWPAEIPEPRPPRIPNTTLLGAVYLLATSVPAFLAVGWSAEGGGIGPLIAWGIVGMATAGGLALWARRWVAAAASVVPHLGPGADAQPVEVSGVVFAAHWGIPYLIALTPALEQEPDTRGVVLAAAVAAGMAGTAIWAGARARRVAARPGVSGTVETAPL